MHENKLDYAIELFQRFGDVFTHLRADESLVQWHDEMMGKVLKTATKLEYLQVGTSHYYTEEDPRFPFSSLRILSFDYIYHKDKRDLTEVIRSAPKLQEIRHVSSDSIAEMEALRKTQKIDLVSSLTLSGNTKPHIFSELTMNPPQLTALTVQNYGHGHDLGQFHTALKSILIHSQNSLKKLKFSGSFKPLDDLPVLYSLEELHLKFDTTHGYQHPGGVSAVLPLLSNSVFPKLKSVRLDGRVSEITKACIDKHFWAACDIPLESVDKLELDTYCKPAVIEYLAKLFPRVTYISVGYMRNIYDGKNRQQSNIWLLKAFQCLSKLQILGCAYYNGTMDTFLTGIPKEIVAKLRTAPKENLSSSISEILRPRGNILQLKNLRELTVIIVPLRSPLNPSREGPFITMVSIWYALQMIPGLRANFLCCCSGTFQRIQDHYEDFQEKFQAVKHCVTIGQCFCETHEGTTQFPCNAMRLS